jgi:hypothetical protein
LQVAHIRGYNHDPYNILQFVNDKENRKSQHLTHARVQTVF